MIPECPLQLSHYETIFINNLQLTICIMPNIAMVGYSKLNSGHRGDLVEWVPEFMEGESGIHYCYVGVVDAPEADSERIMRDILESGADVLHYANFRDPYRAKPFDEIFVESIHALLPEMPILITSALPKAQKLADRVEGVYMQVPFNFEDYAEVLNKLADRRKHDKKAA